MSMLISDGGSQRWSVGFASEYLANGSGFRTFNIVNDCGVTACCK
jgi:hypothetical protein